MKKEKIFYHNTPMIDHITKTVKEAEEKLAIEIFNELEKRMERFVYFDLVRIDFSNSEYSNFKNEYISDSSMSVPPYTVVRNVGEGDTSPTNHASNGDNKS